VILGGSGCGKSTFLRCLIGLHRPTEGEILIDGVDITRLSVGDFNTIRMKFGVLFQSSALFNSMTVADNIALALRDEAGDGGLDRIRESPARAVERWNEKARRAGPRDGDGP